MEVSFEVVSRLYLDAKPGKTRGKHLRTEVSLSMSNNVDHELYTDGDGYPNSSGSEAITGVLVQALILNIHKSHKEGFRNDVEHLRFIIDELGRGFAENVETGNSYHEG